MTAYLQPGDRIHLAFPISPVKIGLEREAEIKQQSQFYIDQYEAHGVNIEIFTPSPALAAPVIVAVFRDKPNGETDR